MKVSGLFVFQQPLAFWAACSSTSAHAAQMVATLGWVFAQTGALGALRDQAGQSTWTERLLSLVGIAALVGVAWLMSSHRKLFPWRIVLWGVGLQVLFGVIVLRTSPGRAFFTWMNTVVDRLLSFTEKGSRFVFGAYYDAEFSVAIRVLPTILFFSALMTVLYHLGVMQRVVAVLAWVMQKTMRTSGPETLSAAANIFVGQTEAPLVVKPYVERMTVSELNAVMVGGFATVAGGVMAAYVGMLRDKIPDISGHLIAASVMSAPAALLVAKVMLPETQPTDHTPVTDKNEKIDANVIDAAARGAAEGLALALNVAAMLLVFLAMVALLNFLLGMPVMMWNDWFHTDYAAPTLEGIFGKIFWPLSFIMGVSPEDCSSVGALLGEKIVLNEFVAYEHLARNLASDHPMGARSAIIATYALCGFANFGSIGIQVGGIGAIAPSRRGDLARIGLRAMFGGTLAACMTGAVAGLLL